MLELEKILKEPEALAEMLKQRFWDKLDLTKLQRLIEKNKKLTGDIQKKQAERNTYSKEIGLLLSKQKKKEAEEQKQRVRVLGDKISQIEEQKVKIETELNEILLSLPNWLSPEVPRGDEDVNEIIRVEGSKPKFPFPARTHYDIGEKQKLLDSERGVKLASSRFYTYWGRLARLERVLLQFMLDLHTREFGYTEVFVPMLVNDASMLGTGQFPKFRGDYYSLERDGLSLIPTAEVPLVNLYRNEILSESQLPIALTAASSCFRREAGAAGKDTRGLVRVHQFQKVELVQLVHPEESEAIHETMLTHAEEVLRRLELPYRVSLKASGDTGATASKSYDLEVWMPGLERWLEISSVSNCLDYQARRARIRFKGKAKGAKTRFAHTLNGSGLAAGRTMIAIMENYQTEDEDFRLPKALEKYFSD